MTLSTPAFTVFPTEFTDSTPDFTDAVTPLTDAAADLTDAVTPSTDAAAPFTDSVAELTDAMMPFIDSFTDFIGAVTPLIDSVTESVNSAVQKTTVPVEQGLFCWKRAAFWWNPHYLLPPRRTFGRSSATSACLGTIRFTEAAPECREALDCGGLTPLFLPAQAASRGQKAKAPPSRRTPKAGATLHPQRTAFLSQSARLLPSPAANFHYAIHNPQSAIPHPCLPHRPLGTGRTPRAIRCAGIPRP